MPASKSPAKPRVDIQRSLARVAFYDDTIPLELRDALWKQPERLINQGMRLRWKIRRTVLLELAERQFVLKHYVEQSRRHAIKHLFQASRAWCTWTLMRRLADQGIATPRPVACIENRWGPLRRDSYLMYPYVAGCTLGSYLGDEAMQSPSASEGVRQQLHSLWQQLAQLRVSLEDAHVGNFIVSPGGRLWLIDLDKSRFHRVAFIASRRQKLRWQQLNIGA